RVGFMPSAVTIHKSSAFDMTPPLAWLLPTVAKATRWPSGDHAGLIAAKSSLEKIDVTLRAAPLSKSSVQIELSQSSRRFMRWKTILLPDGDQSGSRPSTSSNTCVLPVSRSFTLRTQSPPRPSCEEQYTIFLPSGDQLGCRLSVPRSLSTTTVVGASTRSAIRQSSHEPRSFEQNASIFGLAGLTRGNRLS